MELQVYALCKRFGKYEALSNITINFSRGLYGILGRNGAGKTTLFRIMTELLEPTSGFIRLVDNCGNVISNRSSVIGYLPQEFGFPGFFTVGEIITQICVLRGMGKKMIDIETQRVLAAVNLESKKETKYSSLSGGMKRRVGIAQAMIGSPDILILDEPTEGVDPSERVAIRSIINEYARNKTVLLSTHIISDIEHICEKIVVLEAGEVRFCGDVSELMTLAGQRLTKVAFPSTKEFDNYAKDNLVLTFRRVNDCLEAIIPKSVDSRALSDVSLEDAYMWVINNDKINHTV